MAEIPTEVVVGGFAALGGAVGLLWRHFQRQTEQMRTDFKDRVVALEAALNKAMLEIKELRHYERDRLWSLAEQAHEREHAYKGWLRRMAKCADCPGNASDADTDRIAVEPLPPRGSTSSFQPVARP